VTTKGGGCRCGFFYKQEDVGQSGNIAEGVRTLLPGMSLSKEDFLLKKETSCVVWVCFVVFVGFVFRLFGMCVVLVGEVGLFFSRSLHSWGGAVRVPEQAVNWGGIQLGKNRSHRSNTGLVEREVVLLRTFGKKKSLVPPLGRGCVQLTEERGRDRRKRMKRVVILGSHTATARLV